MLTYLKSLIRRLALWLLAWVDACPICGARWLEHMCPYTPAVTVPRFCVVCGVALPVKAERFHDGRWVCAKDKGTT